MVNTIKSPVNLTVQSTLKPSNAPGKATIRRWITAALAKDQIATITVRFVGKKEGKELNYSFREKDYATNILTFPYDYYEDNEDLIQGDLVLCEKVVEEEALAQNKPLGAHYALLIIHGILHLRGFDHGEDLDANLMEALESKILAEFNFKREY